MSDQDTDSENLDCDRETDASPSARQFAELCEKVDRQEELLQKIWRHLESEKKPSLTLETVMQTAGSAIDLFREVKKAENPVPVRLQFFPPRLVDEIAEANRLKRLELDRSGNVPGSSRNEDVLIESLGKVFDRLDASYKDLGSTIGEFVSKAELLTKESGDSGQ